MKSDWDIGEWDMVDEDLIREMKAGIGYQPRKIEWGMRTISPELLRDAVNTSRLLDSLKQDITHQAALNLFEVVKGGELYRVQVEWVEHNLELWLSNLERISLNQSYGFPLIRVGYEGSIHKVEVK